MRQFLQRNAYLFLTSFSVVLAVQVHGQGSGAPAQSPNNTGSSRQTPPKKPATATGIGGSAATPRGSAGTGTPPPGSAAPANDGLDPKYLEFEVLGMRFRPPVQSIMRADGSGITAQWTISERADPPRFVLRVSRLVASDATSTPAQQIDSYIKSVSERPSPNAVFAVRSRKEFELDGRPAALLYTSLREGTGDDEISAVQGYFILQFAPNEFVVISSLLAEQDFASVSQLLERSFRTMQVANQAALADERSGRIARGDHLLRGLDEEAMRRALDPVGAKGEAPAPRWYRITRVDATGDVKDVGYMTMVVIDATQGLANPDRREAEWTKTEKERGLLVRMQVRTLLDATGTAFSDTEARYWTRWDRGREFWTVRSTIRKDRASSTSTQLGIRSEPTSGSPRPILEVADVVPNEVATEPRRWPIPEVGYVSQAESLVLPRLFPKVDAPIDYGFYCFDPRSGRLAQRVDRQTPTAKGYNIATQTTLEAPAIAQFVDERGILLKRSSDDGSVIEATTGQALLELWQRKGLPTK
ncbi:MAG: hypothetical protein RI986_992 [Planctomycetota bacterium]